MIIREQPCRVLAKEGLHVARVMSMIQASTPMTHEWANRKYHGWMFRVNMDTLDLERIAYYPMEGYRGTGDFFCEECDFCKGEGCQHCGWHGGVKVHLTNY